MGNGSVGATFPQVTFHLISGEANAPPPKKKIV